MRTRRVKKVEEPLVNADGTRIWIETIKAPIINDRGEVIGTTGIARDVTSRHAMEEALKDSDQRFRSLVASVPGVIYRCRHDDSYTATYLSDAIVDLSGYPASDYIDNRVRPFSSLIHPDDLLSVRETVKDRVLRGEPFETEYRILHRDGTIRWAHGSGRAVRDASGSVAFLDGFILDVTAQRISKQKVRESELKFKTLYENASEAIFMIDARSGAIVECNVRAEDLLRKKRTEILGEHHSLLHLDAESSPEVFETSPSANNMDRIISDVVRADGSRVPVLITARTVQLNSRPVIVKMVVDMTTYKGAEEAAQKGREAVFQSQKMEALGMLAGGIAHDFNNLLAAIMGFTDLIIDATPTDDPRLADLKEVKDAAGKAADLTRRLLTFGRKQVTQPTAVDLNDVVRGISSILGRTLGEETRLRLSLTETSSSVMGDRTQLEQVILNLCVNAREAMPLGGDLIIETMAKSLSMPQLVGKELLPPGCYIRLRVSDSGTGMPPEVLERMFDPFYTTKRTGSGLGLSIVYSIVKQAGGHLYAESEMGAGTRFDIYLPFAFADPKTAVIPARPPRRGSERILLVEDEPEVRRVAARMLTAHGYQVIAVRSPFEALKEPDLGSFHLMITDVVMPGMTGKELSVQVSRKHPGLKILFMSGYAGDFLGDRGVIPEETNFIPKPFTVLSFLEKVEAVLSDA